MSVRGAAGVEPTGGYWTMGRSRLLLSSVTTQHGDTIALSVEPHAGPA